MSCLACDALKQLALEGHTCVPREAMSRRFYLAAAALPALIARNPVVQFGAGAVQTEVLRELCDESYAIADMMERAEGKVDAFHAVAPELLRVLKIVRHVVDHLPARMEADIPAIDRAIAAAEAAGVTCE